MLILIINIHYYSMNKDENVHRFALITIKGEFLKRERETERETERERKER